ncbi:MAG: hypothetical protein ABJC04_04145 [Verrucomicrobiota bacterium]
MNTVKEIERAVEKLPKKDFLRLAAWIDRKREQPTRDHTAFLKSYAAKDEGLYDDLVSR